MSDTTVMASTKPPSKKHRTHDPSQPPPPQSPPPPPPMSSSSEPQPPVTQSNTMARATTLIPDQIAQKQRNQEDIRNLYESYKQIKYCISQKDANLWPELERAYLFLITASRGFASAQLQPISNVISSFLTIMKQRGYVKNFEVYDLHRVGKIKVELLGRIKDCRAITYRQDIKAHEEL